MKKENVSISKMNTEPQLTLGSLFDGSGGFPLGGILSGIEPKWASEIEPFPVLVTHKRLPQVKHYGDVSKLSGRTLEPVDIITFGSPCQDLSIAGKRAGIQEGERSSLFFQAIRIIKEMREATGGKYPRYCVWENVPGAFSSNGGDDFKAVLEAVISVKEEGVEVPAPDHHRWPKADVFLGDGWSVAYRVFDAQYWGVPQRRARIYLVADFAGGSAGEILFKSEGLSGYTPEGCRPWQGAAGGPPEGAGAAVGGADTGDTGRTFCLNTQGQSGVSVTEGQTGTLVAQDHGNHPAVLQSAGFSTEHSANSRSIGYEEEKSPTLRAGVVPAAMMFDNHPQESRYDGPLENCPTVTARYGTGGNNQPLVAEPKGFDRYNGAVTGDISHTLDTGAGNTVPMVFVKGTRPHSAQEGQEWKEGSVANTLNTFDAGESRCNELAVVKKPSYGIGKPAFTSGKKANFNFSVNEEVSPTLQATGPDAVAQPDIRAYGVCSKSSHAMLSDNPNAGFYEAETSRTLDCSGGRPDCSQGGICVVAPEQPGVHAYTQNQRDEVRDLGEKSAALQAQPGMKQQTYVLQGSMIGRKENNGPQGDGINEDVSFTLTGADRHAVAAPAGEHYSASKNSFFTQAVKEQANTLVATDWKEPPLVNDTPNDEPLYIVRRLTPVECARLQGFPDWWCDGLAIPDPSDEELAFWKAVWEEWRLATKPDGKPKTEKQVRKWLADPYTDGAAYKLWGNGISEPVAFFVLAGIAWAAGKDRTTVGE